MLNFRRTHIHRRALRARFRAKRSPILKKQRIIKLNKLITGAIIRSSTREK